MVLEMEVTVVEFSQVYRDVYLYINWHHIALGVN